MLDPKYTVDKQVYRIGDVLVIDKDAVAKDKKESISKCSNFLDDPMCAEIFKFMENNETCVVKAYLGDKHYVVHGIQFNEYDALNIPLRADFVKSKQTKQRIRTSERDLVQYFDPEHK